MLFSMFEECDQFEMRYKDAIKQLSVDPIPIVRISLAIAIRKILEAHPEQKSSMMDIIQTLS
jgi:hypothetical protein